MVSPGAVSTELPESSSEEATRKNLREFYKMAIRPIRRARYRLRHRATGRGGNRRGRHPPHGAGLLSGDKTMCLSTSPGGRYWQAFCMALHAADEEKGELDRKGGGGRKKAG